MRKKERRGETPTQRPRVSSTPFKPRSKIEKFSLSLSLSLSLTHFLSPDFLRKGNCSKKQIERPSIYF